MHLPEPTEKDDLFLLVEELKAGLTDFSTGGTMDNDEYVRIRKILLGSHIRDLVPDYIKECRILNDFWPFIKEFGNYADRRAYLAKTLNPLLDHLEDGVQLIQSVFGEMELIGQGGFGEVFVYRDKLLGCYFAVKFFAPAFSVGGEGHLERFFREARILFELNHPSIIRVFDVSMAGRRPFIKMEFFDGKNLNHVLQNYGAIPPDKALILMENITEALRHAHEDVGVVHRDLKPSNIMVAKPNKFRIIDFGLGVFIESDLISRITKTGVAVAGGYYTAPELVANPKLIHPQSDIYSIGAVWFNILVGRPPAGSNISNTLRYVDNITDEYIQVVLKCLEDHPRRYSSCSELLLDLRKLKRNVSFLGN